MPKLHARSSRIRRRGGALAITAVAMFMALAVGAAGAQASAFTITKTTDPAGDPQPFTYHVTFKPHPGTTPPATDPSPDDFTLTGGQSRTFTVPKGFYTVSELSVSGWKLVAITCTDGGDTDPADKAKIDLGAAKATIELSSTEKKACTFKNAKVVPPSVPPAVTPPSSGVAPQATPPAPGAAPVATTPPAAQGVLGEQAVRAGAVLAAPRRCVSRRYTVSVTAGRVQSVAFSVNGRQVRTVTARPGQRRFSVQLPRPAGVSNVVARVRFRANTTPATRTLRARIRSCAQQAVQPQFTG
jgi:hypothetical protein